MKRVLCYILTILTLIIPITVWAQSAKEALLALKKLQTRIEAGVSYKDYSSFVADAIFPVRLFLESQEAKDSPELSTLMKSAADRYSFAATVWNQRFGKYGSKWISDRYPLFSQIRSEYPNVPVKDLVGPVIYIDEALPRIWSKASMEVDEAAKIMSREEIKVRDKAIEFEALKAENKALDEEISRLKDERDKLQVENDRLRNELEGLKTKKPIKKNK